MLSFPTPVVAISLFALLFFSCAEFKQAGRDIGHGTRDIIREIGHGTRDAVKAIGHGSRDAFNEFKKDIKSATD
ncbi:hypothetical protein MNBD_GAMMA21-1032 [hydrothermal vent metagenome]|uniref:Uncharacterized protein n=1 Tax=hydrothermal vent metagenome TaxID=652676 RepID=A0A3B0ZXJ5_9ZZZZ